MKALGISPLLVEHQTLADARHTMKIAAQAASKGNLRLGVSRAITAVIQASIVAASTKNKSTKLYADLVIQDARELIMGIVVEGAKVHRMRKMG